MRPGSARRQCGRTPGCSPPGSAKLQTHCRRWAECETRSLEGSRTGGSRAGASTAAAPTGRRPGSPRCRKPCAWNRPCIPTAAQGDTLSRPARLIVPTSPSFGEYSLSPRTRCVSRNFRGLVPPAKRRRRLTTYSVSRCLPTWGQIKYNVALGLQVPTRPCATCNRAITPLSSRAVPRGRGLPWMRTPSSLKTDGAPSWLEYRIREREVLGGVLTSWREERFTSVGVAYTVHPYRNCNVFRRPQAAVSRKVRAATRLRLFRIAASVHRTSTSLPVSRWTHLRQSNAASE